LPVGTTKPRINGVGVGLLVYLLTKDKTSVEKYEFLDRVRTSESTLQEAFTNEAIKAIYTTLHTHAINALAKNNSVSNVDNLLSGWTEYENVSQMWQSNPLLCTRLYNRE
jgi:hypothetical protein